MKKINGITRKDFLKKSAGENLDMNSLHMKNWMECIWTRNQPNADVRAGYNHSVANIMTTAALRTGKLVTYDEKSQEVLAGGEVFQY